MVGRTVQIFRWLRPSKAVAARLAGRLAFAAWAVFGPRIRARLMGLYVLAAGGDPAPAEHDLAADVDFLCRIVRDSGLRVALPLVPSDSDPMVIFTDAEGWGGVGAVIITTSLSGARYKGGRVPSVVVDALQKRKTQIAAFELVCPAAAAASWEATVRSQRVIFYIDNDSALGIVRKGSSRKADLNRIAFYSHELFHDLHIFPIFLMVASEYNCSDPVSRGAQAPFGSDDGLLCWPRLV